MAAAEPTPSRARRFGAYELDLRAGELRKSGVKVRLQDQPLQILTLLLERPGEIVTREEICKRLWPDGTFVDFDHSLNAAVMRLREALEDSADSPRFVETVPRRGYRFIAPVEMIALPASRAVFRQRWMLGWVALTGVLATLLALNVAGLRDRFLGRPAADEITSIAVLPFEDLSGTEDDAFAQGMTDALITRLGRVSALSVIGRTSIMQYKNSGKRLRDIASELKVDALLEGTVQREGRQLRLNARLIEGRTERVLWTETFEREHSAVLFLQADLAQAVAREIRIRVQPQEQARLADARPINPEAHEAYLKGRYHANRWSREGAKKAVAYFNQVLEKDPEFAPAYAGIANAYLTLADKVPLSESKELVEKGKRMAWKALELDDSLSEPHVTLGFFLYGFDRDWKNGERSFRRAIALNPSDAEAHHGLAYYLTTVGRHEEAIAEMKRALALNPVFPSMATSAHWTFYCARRYDEAIKRIQEALELNPNEPWSHVNLGVNYMGKGMTDEAIQAFEKGISLSKARNHYFLGRLGNAYAVAGRRNDALRIVEELKRPSDNGVTSATFIAQVYTGLGETSEAIRWLEIDYKGEYGVSWLETLRVDPIWDPLRSDARFQDLLRRMNFPP